MIGHKDEPRRRAGTNQSIKEEIEEAAVVQPLMQPVEVIFSQLQRHTPGCHVVTSCDLYVQGSHQSRPIL